MEFFDTHVHYDDEKFDNDLKEIMEKIYKMGVTKCINMGCDIDSSVKSIEISKRFDFVYVACGLHPENIPQTEEEICKTILKIRNLIIENRKVVALGEIGLDYYWKNNNKELQKLAFKKQIELANELGLPISIHTRDSIDDTISIIRKTKIKNSGVLHCCPFNRELVKHALEEGLYIAFGGTSTFKNSKNVKLIMEMVPLNRILIETDSPYLAPEPVRGTRNDSSNLRYIVDVLAKYKNITIEEMSRITYENAKRLFLENKN